MFQDRITSSTGVQALTRRVAGAHIAIGNEYMLTTESDI